jgi:maltooligosyltrehalose trehalohydrolase
VEALEFRIRSALLMEFGFGAIPFEVGVRFRVWAPEARELRLVLHEGAARGDHTLCRDARGFFELSVAGAAAGDTYSYSIDGSDPLPDPASRFQPEGVHGPSEIIDPAAFTWHDEDWRGPSPRELIVYELHVGTFAPGGSFASVRDRLGMLKDLGVTAIELMPLADFPGSRNWGYDGVCLFAPSRAYGRPEDLRLLVDQAHALGLAVILDVVYYHLGPEGAYLTHFTPEYLTEQHENPWGRGVNLDGPGSEVVRRFIIENAVHWVREYHVDGLRLDATHALIDDHDRTGREPFVRELAACVRREAGGHAIVHAEDHRNLSDLVDECARGWGLDGVWADDFHHVVRRLVSGDSHGHYADFQGTTEELVRIIRQGWLFTGQHSRHLGRHRGTDPSRVPMNRFVVCLQNHDQIGNRAVGDRLNHQVDPATWRAASTLLLMAPMTPLLFMGQEWAASTPFCYFTDLEPDLGAKVTEGRRREFKHFPEFAAPDSRDWIPDPQAPATFEASCLRWQERERQPHRGSLELYRALIALRRQHPELAASEEREGNAWAANADTVVLCREGQNAAYSVIVRLRGSGDVHLTGDARVEHAKIVLTTEEQRFIEDAQPPDFDASAGRVSFHRPGAIILVHDPRNRGPHLPPSRAARGERRSRGARD